MERRFLTLCERDTVGAQPLYTDLKDGVRLYVAELAYSEQETERILAQAAEYSLKKHYTEESSTFHGFVSGMSYSEEDEVADEPMEETAYVVENGAFGGYVLTGSYRYYPGEDDEDDKVYERQLYLPANGRWMLTGSYYHCTIYGHDGEEDESSSRTSHCLVKKL